MNMISFYDQKSCSEGWTQGQLGIIEQDEETGKEAQQQYEKHDKLWHLLCLPLQLDMKYLTLLIDNQNPWKLCQWKQCKL